MPEPTSIDNVHTLLGMVTYTCKFLPNLSSVTEPLRELIKESNKPGFEFHFDEPHKKSFEELKRMMTNAPVLQPRRADNCVMRRVTVRPRCCFDAG